MTDLSTELIDLAKAREQVGSIASSLSHEQDRLHRSLQEFLGTGWTGPAAREFATAWSDWGSGSKEVLKGLHALGNLLENARVEFVKTDDGVRSTMARLTVRLGPTP